MKSKLIILVVLASLVQCSLALSRSVAYGLSATDSTHLTEIKSNQDKALDAKSGVSGLFFDVVDKYVFMHISGLKTARSDDDSFKITEAKANAIKAIDYSLKGIDIAFGGSCSAIEVAREALQVNIDETFAALGGAWKLALNKNYSANEAQIRVYQDAARKAIADLVQNGYGLFRTCLNTEDTGLLTAVKNSETGSDLSLRQVVDTKFSAIKIYASLKEIKIENGLLTSTMQSLRNLAYDSFKSDIENKFALIRTIYLNSKLNNSKIWLGLWANQYSLIASNNRFQEEADIMIGSMMAAMRRVYLGISIDGSSIDADEARAAEKISAGSRVYWQSILFAYSDGAALIAAATKASANVLTNAMEVFYSAIRGAQNSSLSYEQSLEITDKANQTLSDTVVIFNQIRFNAIRDNRTLDSHTEARVATLENAALDAHAVYLEGVFGAARDLAKAYFSGKASKEDIAALRAHRAVIRNALEDYTQVISTAGVIVLNAINP